MSKTRTIPQAVDFQSNSHDFECAMMGALGFSTKYIASQTKLTKCQVTYRLGKAEIKRVDYRDGASPMARHMMKDPAARNIAKRML